MQVPADSLKVLYFGQTAEAAGTSSEWLSVSEIADILALQEEVKRLHPALNGMTFRIALNKKLVHANTKLNAGDEAGLLPPYAGG